MNVSPDILLKDERGRILLVFLLHQRIPVGQLLSEKRSNYLKYIDHHRPMIEKICGVKNVPTLPRLADAAAQTSAR